MHFTQSLQVCALYGQKGPSWNTFSMWEKYWCSYQDCTPYVRCLRCVCQGLVAAGPGLEAAAGFAPLVLPFLDTPGPRLGDSPPASSLSKWAIQPKIKGRNYRGQAVLMYAPRHRALCSTASSDQVKLLRETPRPRMNALQQTARIITPKASCWDIAPSTWLVTRHCRVQA